MSFIATAGLFSPLLITQGYTDGVFPACIQEVSSDTPYVEVVPSCTIFEEPWDSCTISVIEWESDCLPEEG